MDVIELPLVVDDQVLNLCLETASRGKQALVFCNTKRGAEAQAERIAKKLGSALALDADAPGPAGERARRLAELAEKILNALDSPTRQCKRLALCARHGAAFHHAGLSSKQRELIEESFRTNLLSFICCTPTLAMGLDLPAFRSIVKDVKRFTPGHGWGMQFIPVLEYHQMAGRAGRPGQEEWGEAVLVARNKGEAEELAERFIRGDAEEVVSKLAVEPVLRTYLLSLIATGFINDTESMRSFFDRTFYAAQYGDASRLHAILDKMLGLLEEWEFIAIGGSDRQSESEFLSADEIAAGRAERFRATPLGRRVAELYLDPLTAAFLVKHLRKATALERGAGSDGRGDLGVFPLLHMISSTLEMRPLLRPRVKEYNMIDEKIVETEGELLVPEPNQYGFEFEEFQAAIKTAMLFEEWIDESGEELLLEKFGVRPGELHAKRETADWLLYSCEELSKLLAFQQFLTPLAKMRIRLEYGVKEQLLNLLRMKGVGKKRARVLYKNGIKSVGDIKLAEVSTLAALVGRKIAANIKEQVGQSVDPEKIAVKPRKRKGQKSIKDWEAKG